jgi:hypothetical protein
VVEVGDALAGVPEDDPLVGGAHERRVPLVLGVQGDDPNAVPVFLVELAHGPDQAHGGLAPVDDGDALEHPRDSLVVNPGRSRRSGSAGSRRSQPSPVGSPDLVAGVSIVGGR